MADFKDHFSSIAGAYAEFRPRYPAALFDWLAGVTSRRETCWDCATGSGQAASELARRFRRVVATDGSAAQLAAARPDPRIEYRVGPAERSGLPDDWADAITVAQAMHWLDPDGFYREAERVARPGAVVAVWGYDLLAIEPGVDRVITRFYRETMRRWWAPERRLVDDQYRSLPWPFEPLEFPSVAMTADWTLGHLLGYLGSWSAVRACLRETGRDPVADLAGELEAAWGPGERSRPVSWPLFGRAGRVR
ncbi:MAG: class I SAM-dependent methyltransferase [Gemmatimonadales bacterium]